VDSEFQRASENEGAGRIPSMVPHDAWALEDSVDLDVVGPPREDWLNKTDDYLRHGR